MEVLDRTSTAADVYADLYSSVDIATPVEGTLRRPKNEAYKRCSRQYHKDEEVITFMKNDMVKIVSKIRLFWYHSTRGWKNRVISYKSKIERNTLNESLPTNTEGTA